MSALRISRNGAVAACWVVPRVQRHSIGYSSLQLRHHSLVGNSSTAVCVDRRLSIATCCSASQPSVLQGKGQNPLITLYRFSRPHTVLGTFVSIVSISMLAVNPSYWTLSSASVVACVCKALVPALLMNICIVGLNQIYDIEIDKINKPYLPLASGELSVPAAWWIVSGAGMLSLALGAYSQSIPLLWTLVGSLVLGIAYSIDIPYLRWKKYPTLAAMCILSVRAVLVQFGFYLHMKFCQHSVISDQTILQYILGEKSLIFTTCFMLVFSIVIALFKDIPDMQGDQQSGLRTFAVKLGTRRIFWTCISLLQLAYASSIIYSIVVLENPVVKVCSTLLHGVAAAFVLSRAKQTDLSSPKHIYACYMDVWKAFYFEYMLIPLLR